jgi:hypothetical protein
MLEKGLMLHFSHLEIEEIFHIPSAKNIFLAIQKSEIVVCLEVVSFTCVYRSQYQPQSH